MLTVRQLFRRIKLSSAKSLYHHQLLNIKVIVPRSIVIVWLFKLMNILKRLILRNCCCRRPKFQLDQDRVFTFVTHRAEHLLRKLYCFYSNFKPHSTGFVDLLVGFRPKSPPQFWVLARCKLFFNCTNLIESNDEQGRDQNISFQGI